MHFVPFFALLFCLFNQQQHAYIFSNEAWFYSLAKKRLKKEKERYVFATSKGQDVHYYFSFVFFYNGGCKLNRADEKGKR